MLSGNFGELRSNHFHTGLDIKTNGKINYKIYAIEEGLVSRINISHWVMERQFMWIIQMDIQVFMLI